MNRTDTADVESFHFVCQGKGVVETAPGYFTTEAWAVQEKHAARAVETGARLGLHPARHEPSTRQGVVTKYEVVARKGEVARPNGIRFTVRETNEPLSWRGEGTGEKGYGWSDGRDRR